MWTAMQNLVSIIVYGSQPDNVYNMSVIDTMHTIYRMGMIALPDVVFRVAVTALHEPLHTDRGGYTLVLT